jgi:hypothetical protein
MPELAIYEVRVTGVKLSGLNPSIWPRPGVAAKGYFAQPDQRDFSCPVGPAKRFVFSPNPNQRHIARRPGPITRGVSRSSRTLGAGCDGRGDVEGRTTSTRTAKSCGPDISTLMSSLRNLFAGDGGKKARSPGRSRSKPLKPLRGECRANPV